MLKCCIVVCGCLKYPTNSLFSSLNGSQKRMGIVQLFHLQECQLEGDSFSFELLYTK